MKQKLMLAVMLCGTLCANAQDTYWPMSGNKIFNTNTKAIGVSTQDLTSFGGGFSFDGDPTVIFNDSKEVLFTSGPNSPNFSAPDIGQVLTIPNKCKEYLSVKTEYVPTPHGHSLSVYPVDVTGVTNNITTTNVPSVGTPVTLHSAQNAVYYGAVAAKLNPNGSRYLYHMNVIVSTFHSILNRYEINASGNLVSTTPTAIATLSNHYGTQLDISPDGETLAFIRDNGQFCTYNLATSVLTDYSTTFTMPFGVYAAIECVKVGSTRRWFVASRTKVGYFNEGSTTFVDMTTTSNVKGLQSSLALGRDGNIYFAYNTGGIGSGTGQLAYFSPSSAGTGNINAISTNITGASVPVNYGVYYFGNQVAGDDVNSATAPMMPPGFTINGQTGGDIIVCERGQLMFNGILYGIHSGYHITVEEGILNNFAQFVATGDVYDDQIATANTLVARDLVQWFPGLLGYSGYIRVTFSTISPCGNTLSTTYVFNIKLASAAVDFYVIGPSDLSSNPACNYLGVSNAGLQLRAPTAAAVVANTPASQVGPPCAEGWVGASTVGISKGVITPYNTTTVGPTPYRIVVDEYDAALNPVKLEIIKKTFTTFPASSYPFSNKFNTAVVGSPINYFTNNYRTGLNIQNNYFYKITVTVETGCGPYSKEAWFKILDGLEDGIVYRHANSVSELIEAEQPSVYPNPATNMVNVTWNGTGTTPANIMFTNVMGQVVLQQNLTELEGANTQGVDVSKLAAGVYHYSMTTAGTTHKGKLVKQ